jgi:hypothetical protein
MPCPAVHLRWGVQIDRDRTVGIIRLRGNDRRELASVDGRETRGTSALLVRRERRGMEIIISQLKMSTWIVGGGAMC